MPKSYKRVTKELQKSYKRVTKELQRVTKSYKELQRVTKEKTLFPRGGGCLALNTFLSTFLRISSSLCCFCCHDPLDLFSTARTTTIKWLFSIIGAATLGTFITLWK
jgi:hypothetical protein